MNIIERDSPEWHQAWDALHAAGYRRESFMLMHATASAYAFKNINTRRYVDITREAQS